MIAESSGSSRGYYTQVIVIRTLMFIHRSIVNARVSGILIKVWDVLGAWTS